MGVSCAPRTKTATPEEQKEPLTSLTEGARLLRAAATTATHRIISEDASTVASVFNAMPTPSWLGYHAKITVFDSAGTCRVKNGREHRAKLKRGQSPLWSIYPGKYPMRKCYCSGILYFLVAESRLHKLIRVNRALNTPTSQAEFACEQIPRSLKMTITSQNDRNKKFFMLLTSYENKMVSRKFAVWFLNLSKTHVKFLVHRDFVRHL